MKPTKIIGLLLVLGSQTGWAAAMKSTNVGTGVVKPCSRSVERARSAKTYDQLKRQVAAVLGAEKAAPQTAGRSAKPIR